MSVMSVTGVIWTYTGADTGSPGFSYSWDDPGNWSPTGFTGTIGPNDTANIPGAAQYQNFTSSGVLYLNGSIVNQGAIVFTLGYQYPNGTQYPPLIEVASVTVTANTELSGGGTVNLGDYINPYSGDPMLVTFRGPGAGAAPVVFENVDNTIFGAGTIDGYGENLTFQNDAMGVVNGDGATDPLTFERFYSAAAGPSTNDEVINDGVLELTGGAGLVLNGDTIDDFGGGTIEASGSGVVTITGGTYIDGGSLTTTNGGVIQLTGSGAQGEFDGTNGASVTITLGTTINVAPGGDSALLTTGAIVNQGVIALDPTGGATLELVGDTTLSGGGQVTMADGANGTDKLWAGGGTIYTLENVDNTITGAGGIYGAVSLTNDANGVIDASNAANPLSIEVNVVNTGLLESTGAGGLVLTGDTIDDSGGGVIKASGAGVVTITGDAEILGGSLTTTNGGVIQLTGSGAQGEFNGTNGAPVTITLGTTINVTPGGDSALLTTGAIVNQGVIALDPTGGATLELVGDTTLSGGGQVTMADGANGTDKLWAGGGTIYTLENVDNTITGAGRIYGAVSLTNDANGVIDASDAANPLSIEVNVVNNGLLESTGAGGLVLTGDTVDDFGGGTIKASGAGVVTITGDAEILGGSLTTTNGGVIQLTGSGAQGEFNGTNGAPVTITQGTTINVTPGGDSALLTTGAIVNQGVIALDPTGGATLELVGDTTLSGGGQVTMADGANGTDSLWAGGGTIYTLENVDNTIMGAGRIYGVVSLTNDANGVVDASDATNGLSIEVNVVNTGVLEANGGQLLVEQAVTGTGSVLITGGGDASFSAAFSQNATFQGDGAGKLSLAQSYTGVVSGFEAGDAIDLTNVAFKAGDHFVYQSTTNGVETYALENAGNTVLSDLSFAGSYTAADFTINQDSGSGTQIGFAPSVADTNNFSGGPVSGILWYNSTYGTVLDWEMANAAVVGWPTIAGFGPTSGWSVAGTGDFNGDGVSDVLLKYVANGETSFGDWIVQNGTYSSYSPIAGFANNSGWAEIGTGDFTGNGTDDVLLSYTSGNNVSLYDWQISNGATVATDSLNMGYTTTSGWSVIGTGDFNGDGTTDILFENSNSGLVADWEVNNNTSGAFNPIAGVAPGSGWVYDGTGDFNGDGTSDILWQNGATVAIWELQNGVLSQSVTVSTAAPTGYVFEGIGDYTGSGTSDILWQSPTNGQTMIWEMQNGQVAATATPGGADPSSWQIVK